ncbi:MAG: hypothetical protein Q4P06_00840 [Actinomycetaceae bacterium]|nr:hypothetical protein [Actinomycetaceae bacterium]
MKPAATQTGRRVSWCDLVTRWTLVRVDLLALYGVREWEMHTEPFTVLRGLVFSLLSHPESQTANVLGILDNQ